MCNHFENKSCLFNGYKMIDNCRIKYTNHIKTQYLQKSSRVMQRTFIDI
jgi:hypothetical protein